MKLIAPIEKDEDIVNKQYVDNKISTKVEDTETGISTALDKIRNNTTNAVDTDIYITKVNNKYYKRPLNYLWNWIKTKVEALGYTKNTGTLTGIEMNGVSKGTSGVVDLGTVLTGGSQTTTSTKDGGSNVYTFSDDSTITVRNGTKGSKGDIGPQGPRGEKGDTGTAATISVGKVTTGAAGTNAVVTNAGTSSAAKFNFTIPRGANGTNGTSATWFTGTAVTGTSTTAVTVSVTGSKAGDMYLNTSTYNVYSAAAANSWVYKCNIKGATGSAGSSGTSAGFGTPTATVDANTGTPSVTVTATGPNTAKVFNFAFKNLKGEKGDIGEIDVVSSSANGLAPKITNTNAFLKGNGTWSIPEDSKIKISSLNPAAATWYYPIWSASTSGTTTGNINDGLMYNTSQGTAEKLGHSYLRLGNATASGTTGNKRGHLRIYGEDVGYSELVSAATANRLITFPDVSGTVSLDGHTHNYLPLAGGTMTGDIKFNNGANTIILGQNTGADKKSFGYINLYNGGSIAGNIFANQDGGLIVRSMTNNTGSIGDPSHYFNSAYINNFDKVAMIKSSGDTYHTVERTDLTFKDSNGDTQHEDIRFGISTGNNRGIWDRRLGKWLVRADTSGNAYFGDPAYADKTIIRGRAISRISNVPKSSNSNGQITYDKMVTFNERKKAILFFYINIGINADPPSTAIYFIDNTNSTINHHQIISSSQITIFIKTKDGKIGWGSPNEAASNVTLNIIVYD